jgi:hypothetical protein
MHGLCLNYLKKGFSNVGVTKCGLVITHACAASYCRIKEYRMAFRAGLRDPCTRDVAKLSESVKILEPQASA